MAESPVEAEGSDAGEKIGSEDVKSIGLSSVPAISAALAGREGA